MMLEQGDIVLVPFPFTDLSSAKQRPALVISKSDYNKKTEDIITCGITSNLQNADNSVLIDDNDLSEGTLRAKSRVKVGKIFTLKQSLVRKTVAKLKTTSFVTVKEELWKLI